MSEPATTVRPMPAAAPVSLAAIAARVTERVVDVIAAARERWSALDADLAGPFDEIRRMVEAGGKRLRPAFCHWGFVGAGGNPDDQRVVDAGAAFELMHAFALFHDDVMDDASSRRGEPTTHVLYADRHRRHGWSGEPRRFGDGAAILAGDLAFVLADELLVGATEPVWRIWNELRTELNVGQFLDIAGAARRERRIEKAERIARYKSGKYTIERPLHLGALLATPERAGELLPSLSRYGLPLGDAFQMRDDIIGVFGDAALTGKPVGGDLLEGKPTALLARAVASASQAQRLVLDRVGAADLDAGSVAAIQRVIVDTGALADLEAAIDRLSAEAIAALDDIDIIASARSELGDLARYVVGRPG
jgi:geranylgeranyl diphosphate synthase, type I